MVDGIKIKLFAIVIVLADSPRVFRGLESVNTGLTSLILT